MYYYATMILTSAWNQTITNIDGIHYKTWSASVSKNICICRAKLQANTQYNVPLMFLWNFRFYDDLFNEPIYFYFSSYTCTKSHLISSINGPLSNNVARFYTVNISSNLKQRQQRGYKSIGWCDKDATLVRKQWSYVFLALTYRNVLECTAFPCNRIFENEMTATPISIADQTQVRSLYLWFTKRNSGRCQINVFAFKLISVIWLLKSTKLPSIKRDFRDCELL